MATKQTPRSVVTEPAATSGTSAARLAVVHLLSGQVAYRALAAVFWVVLARATIPSEVGEFAVANSIAVLIFVGLDAGLNQYLVREFHPGSGFPLHIRKVIRWRSALVVIGCASAGIGTSLLVPSTTASRTGLLVSSGYALDFLCQAWLAPDRAMLELRPDRLMKLVQGSGSLAAILVINALWTVDAVTASAGVLCAYVLAAAHPLSRWRLQHRWAEDEIGTPPSREIWRSAAAFAATGMLTAFYTRIDDVFVQISRGSIVVASYTLAYKIIETARLPSWAITRVLLADTSDGDESAKWRGRTGVSVRISIVLSAVAALACSTVGPFLTEALYGHRYEAAGSVLRILAVSILFSGFTGPAQGFLLGIGEERAAARATVLTAAVAIAGLAVLTPTFGAQGAAWAVVGAQAAEGAVLVRLLRGHEFDLFHLASVVPFIVVVAALVCGAALPCLAPVAVPIGGTALAMTALEVWRTWR